MGELALVTCCKMCVPFQGTPKKEGGENIFSNWNNPYVTVHFKCRICQKDLPKPSYWKRHYAFHTDNPKFPCPTCGKAFKQACDLKRHQKVHSKSLKAESFPFESDMNIKSENLNFQFALFLYVCMYI